MFACVDCVIIWIVNYNYISKIYYKSLKCRKLQYLFVPNCLLLFSQPMHVHAPYAPLSQKQNKAHGINSLMMIGHGQIYFLN
jgi:hypothetical protein